MIYSVLASGSKGNCTFLECNKTKVLVDIGMPLAYIKDKLNDLGVDLADIEYVLITHLHTDHIASLKSFMHKYKAKIILSEIMAKELDIYQENHIIIDRYLTINEITIDVIKLSHDVKDINGYIFNYKNKKLAFITDTGYINNKNESILKNCNSYIIESNHDVDMLMKCKRPYFEKMRVLGDTGHLSNEACLRYLKKYIGPDTKTITLIHLSEENNTPTLAKNTIQKDISNIDIVISSQKDRTKKVTV